MSGERESSIITYPPEKREQVLGALSEVEDVSIFGPSTVYEHELFSFNAKECVVSGKGKVVQLTHAESRLLGALMSIPNKCLTKEELANLLLGSVSPTSLDRQTIRGYASKLRNKLKTIVGNEAVLQTIRSVGYKIVTNMTVFENRDVHQDPVIFKHSLFSFNALENLISSDSRTIRVGPMQSRFLNLLLQSPNECVLYQFLACGIFGSEELAILYKARIASLSYSLRKKLRILVGDKEVVRTVRGAGYKLVDDKGECEVDGETA